MTLFPNFEIIVVCYQTNVSLSSIYEIKVSNLEYRFVLQRLKNKFKTFLTQSSKLWVGDFQEIFQTHICTPIQILSNLDTFREGFKIKK